MVFVSALLVDAAMARAVVRSGDGDFRTGIAERKNAMGKGGGGGLKHFGGGRSVSGWV